MSDPVMPYGTYRGRTMDLIPSGYLKWLATNFEDDEIASAADEEYRWRTDNNGHWYEDREDE